MRRISAMYEYSGGADPLRTCGECAECITELCGKRKVNKCRKYAELTKTNPDWKTSYMACRCFTITARTPKRARVQQEDEDLPGQMSFEDFPEVMP